MKRLHIVGSGPGTGTTLLHEVMKVCFNIDKSGEHEDSIKRSNSGFGNFDILLTKQPSEITAVKWTLQFDSGLYVICMIRDPRDMITSFHGMYPDRYWCSLRYWKSFCEEYEKF